MVDVIVSAPEDSMVYIDAYGRSHEGPERAPTTEWGYALMRNSRGETLLTISPTTKRLRLPGQEMTVGLPHSDQLIKLVKDQTTVSPVRCTRLLAGTWRRFYDVSTERFMEANIRCYEGELAEDPAMIGIGSVWMPTNKLIEMDSLHNLTSVLLEHALGIRLGMPHRWQGKAP